MPICLSLGSQKYSLCDVLLGSIKPEIQLVKEKGSKKGGEKRQIDAGIFLKWLRYYKHNYSLNHANVSG